MLAHDVRSPAATVVSTLQTVRRLPEARSDATTSLLEAAERQAERICRLSEALLAGGEPETVDLVRLVGDAVAGVRREPRVDVEVAMAMARVDAAAVEQILVNLVDNALKHTSGRVLVAASAGGGQLRLVVTDEGPGLDPDELAELFRPFRRGPTSADGHGLGLYIVRVLVDALDGHLDALTGPDRGTEVTVLLPLAAA